MCFCVLVGLVVLVSNMCGFDKNFENLYSLSLSLFLSMKSQNSQKSKNGHRRNDAGDFGKNDGYDEDMRYDDAYLIKFIYHATIIKLLC